MCGHQFDGAVRVALATGRLQNGSQTGQQVVAVEVIVIEFSVQQQGDGFVLVVEQQMVAG